MNTGIKTADGQSHDFGMCVRGRDKTGFLPNRREQAAFRPRLCPATGMGLLAKDASVLSLDSGLELGEGQPKLSHHKLGTIFK